MLYNIDGVELDLKVRNGILEISQADKTWIASARVVEEEPMEAVTTSVEIDDITPETPVLPSGWETTPDGDVLNEQGISIFGRNPRGLE